MFKALFNVLFIRSKESVFWLVFFPTILFIILTTIFGDMGRNVTFRISFVGESKILKRVFENIDNFEVFFYDEKDSDKILEDLKLSKIDLVVVLPKDFDNQLNRSLLLRKTLIHRPPTVKLFYSPSRQESQLTKEVFESVLNSFGSTQLEVKKHSLSQRKFHYPTFIYPGVVGMALLSTFLFGFINDIYYLRKKSVLRRFYVTPYPLPKFFLSSTVISVIQFILGILILSTLAHFYGVDILSAFPNTLFYLTLGSLVMIFLSIFAVYTLPGTSLFVGTQIFFQVSMFVGGFYFPISQMPGWMQKVAYVLPVSSIVDGLRQPYGYSGFSNNWLVPTVYILIFLTLDVVLFSKRKAEGLVSEI